MNTSKLSVGDVHSQLKRIPYTSGYVVALREVDEG